VNLEDLTWTEVKLAQDKGYDTIIIPTGGTEQNGPHLILGKHNYIVHYTAQKIAEKAGKVLVAPVMSYVPEGSLDDKPTYHMPYPGTITVPDDVFEGLLKAAAESFIHHGFKYVFFLGDSYNNQEPQRIAAEQLMKKWSGKGIVVATLHKYYDSNGQFDWLKSQGYKDAQIGYHAGMRETSEMAVIHPEGIRNHPLLAKDNELPYMPEGTQGYSGDPSKGSASLGKELLKLKIDTAIGEIRTLRNEKAGQ
jgi:creatinine amidohydrolase/Fe(II)-dependent formamide hydrolase-like protein